MRKQVQDYFEENAPKYDEKYSKMGLSTKSIHVGQTPDLTFGSVNVPIYASSTYVQPIAGMPLGKWVYTRLGNPTRNALERCIAALEGGKYTVVFPSGMAAITSTLQLLNPGDEIISINDLYGGTHTNFREFATHKNNLKFTFFDFKDLTKFKPLLNEKVKMVYVESATNPSLTVVDVPEVVKITKEFNKDILVVVDNTFLSPYNFRPLEYGVDICIESCTKYINGHSDVVMGCATVKDENLYQKINNAEIFLGSTSSAFDSYLCLRGIRTLSLRVEQHNQNGLAVAEFLEKHPKVEKVFYPGLESSPFHEVAKKLYKGYGGVVTFVMKGGLEECKKFLGKLKVFHCAVSLGSVESLAEHPALMTHSVVPPEIRKELGIDDGLIRLSVGIENKEDILEDLKQALE
jgi:cystathionine beta-lyase/cystathionine gamma-synthase